jgi:hypothetical protein
MLTTAITQPSSTYITCSFLLRSSIYMRISSQLPIVHYICICACISIRLISFYLWLILIFLFGIVSYGFTPLRHCMSQHYTSQQTRAIHNVKWETHWHHPSNPNCSFLKIGRCPSSLSFWHYIFYCCNSFMHYTIHVSFWR